MSLFLYSLFINIPILVKNIHNNPEVIKAPNFLPDKLINTIIFHRF